MSSKRDEKKAMKEEGAMGMMRDMMLLKYTMRIPEVWEQQNSEFMIGLSELERGQTKFPLHMLTSYPDQYSNRLWG
jgi:hypothetical protein